MHITSYCFILWGFTYTRKLLYTKDCERWAIYHKYTNMSDTMNRVPLGLQLVVTLCYFPESEHWILSQAEAKV